MLPGIRAEDCLGGVRDGYARQPEWQRGRGRRRTCCCGGQQATANHDRPREDQHHHQHHHHHEHHQQQQQSIPPGAKRPAVPRSQSADATAKLFIFGLCAAMLAAGGVDNALAEVVADPTFSAPIVNVTTPVGRDALLTCVVHDLGSFKVAWLRVDTQTILSIQNHVITKNHRVGIAFSGRNTWQLRLREIRESDRGYYMCQINTDPMKSQIGYLDVVVPPDILDFPTSTDMVVAEGSNVTLKCAATGSPQPTITWRRETGEPITQLDGSEVLSIEGSAMTIARVSRQHMGPYLCIASNGVPPSVSKRVMLIVHFSPMIWVPNQLIGAHEGQRVTLECQSEAYPKSINYWTRERGEIVPKDGQFEPTQVETAYKVAMKLHIRSVGAGDFGSYRCVAKNSLGETDGNIKLYRIPRSTSGNVIEALLPNGKLRGKLSGHSNNYDINDISDEDSLGKQKAAMESGGHLDENYGVSRTSRIRPAQWAVTSVVGWLVSVFIAAVGQSVRLTAAQPG